MTRYFPLAHSARLGLVVSNSKLNRLMLVTQVLRFGLLMLTLFIRYDFSDLSLSLCLRTFRSFCLERTPVTRPPWNPKSESLEELLQREYDINVTFLD